MGTDYRSDHKRFSRQMFASWGFPGGVDLNFLTGVDRRIELPDARHGVQDAISLAFHNRLRSKQTTTRLIGRIRGQTNELNRCR